MSKHKLSDKDFEWTPELAYAVGLLTTDGNLSKDGRHIDFTSKDKGLVETFKKCLNLKNRIGRKYRGSYPKKKCYRVQFGNVVFYHWLCRIGLTSNKSKTIGSVKIPNEYFVDFLRGYLDGDGSVTCYIDHWNTYKKPKYIYKRLWTRFYSASKENILWLRKKIGELKNIKGHLWEGKYTRPNQTTSEWTLKFGKKDSLKLLSWLYYNPTVPCLMRKRRIAEKFI